MKLTDLEPQFIRFKREFVGLPYVKPQGGDWGTPRWVESQVHVDTLAEAQGIRLLCPACWTKNGGPVGTHSLAVSFAGRGVPDNEGSHDRDGKPSRWTVSGTRLDDLRLSPSIDIGCWHGHIGLSVPGEVT